MKNILPFLLLAFFIQNAQCDGADILTKFHQKSYKIKDFRFEVYSFDENYYYGLNIVTFKYNRTTTAINVTFTAKVDFHDKLEILIQAYKFLSNEYRHFPLRFQVNLNKAYEANVGGMINAIQCGNITRCYFYKNITYHVCNFVIDETFLPPLVPNGQYKIGVTMLYLEVSIADLGIFGEIYTPMKYPTQPNRTTRPIH